MASRRRELAEAMQAGAVRAATEDLPVQTLAVTPVDLDPGSARAFAGSTAGGGYVLVIVARSPAVAQVPVRMAVLCAEFGVHYVLDDGAMKHSLRVSVIQCTSVDSEVRKLFAAFADELLSALPNAPSDKDVADELARWLGLFWRLQSPSRTDVVGLVGELTLIHASPRPGEWVRAWHSLPTSTIDFILGDPSIEVEVKATQSAKRSHTVSVDQAFGPGHRYFASVLVELRDTGTTLGDFALEIADRLGVAEERERFWRILASECGSLYGEFMGERFIADLSNESLEFFRRDDIPRPRMGFPMPTGVSSLIFRSDFSSTPPVGRTAFFASTADNLHSAG